MRLFQAALDTPLSRQPLLRHPLSSRFALHGLRAFENRPMTNFSARLSMDIRWSFVQKPGNHPDFKKNALGAERPFSELWEFRGILGAALGIGKSILGIRNSILGMASHDLINTKPTILGATLGAIPGIAANPPERFSFAPSFSERFFENWGGPRTQDS